MGKSETEYYDEKERERAEQEKLVAPDDFENGAVGRRHCTDCPCAVLLILLWLVTTGVGLYSVSRGDPRLAIYPLDYDGNVCGTDFRQDMTDYPYLLYVNSYTGGVCVKECPSLQGQVINNLTDIRTLVTYAGMWQPSSNKSELGLDFVEVAPTYHNSSDAIACTDRLCYPDDSPVASWHASGVNRGFGFAYYVGDTYELFWRCYLTTDAQAEIKQQTNAETVLNVPDPQQILLTLFADVWQTKQYVFGFGFGASLGISFLYIFLLRLPLLLSFMVWGSIGATIAMVCAAGWYSSRVATQWSDQQSQRVPDDAIRALRAASVICYILTAILVLLTCCLRRQIQMSIGCVKVAARAINRMPLILMVPVLQAIGFIVALGVFVIYGAYLASLGTIHVLEFPLEISSGAGIAVRAYTFSGTVQGMAWFLLFSLFWTSNFIVAVGDLVVAICVSRWYFTKDKRKFSNCVVVGSIASSIKHVGTLAFGSLLIACVQIIRVVLERLRRALKKIDSRAANTVICCCQCFCCILEACLKFLNKNAYIQTAIMGTPFCRSASQAFYLIVRNAARVGALNYASSSILIVGKLFISAMTTGLAYFALLETDPNKEINHVAGPLVAVFFISYIMSDIFMGVFDMSISTILHCFVADEEMFHGEYAEGPLRIWIDRHSEKPTVVGVDRNSDHR